MTTPRRLPPDDRKAAILHAAVKLATDTSYLSLTREKVARASHVSPGLVTRYFRCSDELRRCVMRVAIDRRILSIVAEGIAARCPVALSAPAEMKTAAVNSML